MTPPPRRSEPFPRSRAPAPEAVGPPARVPLTVRGLTLQWGARTYVMAILNVTPDSFSGDGLDGDVEAAMAAAAAAVTAGADILDVGGESTRPGAAPVSAAEEIARVVPVIAALRAMFDTPISVDTYKAQVARAALDAGADLVNDVWALRLDPALGPLVAARGVPVVLMHNRSDPRRAIKTSTVGDHYTGVEYQDLTADVCRELMERVRAARAVGIRDENVILDPGLGFGKTIEQNLALLDATDHIVGLGYPVLVGPSRKSFVGAALDAPPADRLEGTAAAVAIAIERGADIVRVHDVAAMVKVARMTDAIVRR